MSNTSQITEVALMSPKDTAKWLGLGMTKTWELISSGVIESVKIDSKRLCKTESVRRIAENGASTQEAA